MKNISFLHFWQLPTPCLYRALLNTKMILIYVIALDKIYNISILSFGYFDVLYTSKVLEVVRNGKNSIFLLILLNLSPNKYPFNQYYTKSDILIKNDKSWCWLKFHFRLSPIFAMDISSIKIHWWCRLLTSDIFQTWLPSYVLVFNVICMKLQNMKKKIWPVSKGVIFGPWCT